jgi:hypothetical protein
MLGVLTLHSNVRVSFTLCEPKEPHDPQSEPLDDPGS